MAKYTSGRQRNLKVGISSYSENLTSLEVTGKVGIGTTNAAIDLDVVGGVGSQIIAWDNIIDDDININSAHKSSAIYVDKDLTVDIEDNATITIDDNCYLNIIDDADESVSVDKNFNNLFVSGITTTATLNVGIAGTIITTNNNGFIGIGTTVPTSKLHVVGDVLTTGITTIGMGSTSTPPNNTQMSFELTSNTNLRIKVRGTDGVLRLADITLS